MGALVFQDGVCFSVVSESGKKSLYPRFSGFWALFRWNYRDADMLRWRETLDFPEEFDLLFLRRLQANLHPRWEKQLWFYHPPKEKGSSRQYLIFYSFFCVICIFGLSTGFRKKRMDCSFLLWLNAFTTWWTVSTLFIWPLFPLR